MTGHVTTNLLADASSIQKEYWRRLRDANDMSFESLHVNFSADITFTKEPMIPVTEQCHLAELSLDEFLLYPFAKNVAIVLIRGITSETHDKLYADAVVIEATTRTNDFRMTLES